MNAFEALSKLNSSDVGAIHAICPTAINGQYITDMWYKSEMARIGLVIRPEFFDRDANWSLAYTCENCSGTGAESDDCPKCDGAKILWGDK